MIAFQSLLQVGRYFIPFTLFQGAFAVLQNVTIDDAVLTGAVVPQYLPSLSSWNQGNSCSKCLAKPDPALAYNHTWHDATYTPGENLSQAIEFTFIGSAVYIFFILANTVGNANTLTDMVFYLDEIHVGRFVHSPTTNTDYEYNVPVYVNESLVFGEHSMTIVPGDTRNSVLMLFDYFIYTTDIDDTITTSAASPTASVSPSPTSTGTQGTSSKQNTAAIVGGTVGGICALALVVAASLLCYRRHQRRNGPRLRRSQGPLLGSLSSLHEPFRSPSRIYQMDSLPYEPPSSRRQTFPVTLRPPSIPISIDPPSTVSESEGLAAQVEELRGEVSRLLSLQNRRQNPAPEKA